MIRILLLVIFTSLNFSTSIYSQTSDKTIINGIVTDSLTSEPIPFAVITLTGKTQITSYSNIDGVYTIATKDSVKEIKITCFGYLPVSVPIIHGVNQYIMIKLNPEMKQLSEVIVKGKKKRYRNKNNPAVELIQLVIDNKSKNRIESMDYLQYQKYQKIVFSIDNIKEEMTENFLLKDFKFVFENFDTTIVTGRKLLPIYLKENISNIYFRKKPRANIEDVLSEKLIRFDEYINRRSLSVAINYMSLDINVYDNSIMLLSNQFLSPIASMAPAFYKYYIKDTVLIDNLKCIQLRFQPRNKTDFLFEGDMYVTLDSSYAIKKIDMSVNKEINLNWVKGLTFHQTFEKTKMNWLLMRDEMAIDFGITDEALGIYGQRTAIYQKYVENKPLLDSIYKKNRDEFLDEDLEKDTAYWNANRPINLRPSERNIYIMMDSLKRMPKFQRDINIISTLTAGFYKLGPVELGPVTTIYSFNPIEGSRVKFGGRTTPKLSKKIIFDTYVAYGFKDARYKTGIGVNYSLTDKIYTEFPAKSIRASYQYDMKIPGQDLLYIQDDALLMSIMRGTNDKMYYSRSYKLEHSNEFINHFSYKIAYEYNEKTPAGKLFFNTIDYQQQANNVSKLNTSMVSFGVRYAPNEKFFQGSMYRSTYPSKYPVFQLKYSAGNKIIGSDYNFQTIRFDASKRFLMSILGFTDMSIEAGRVFGNVPYPLLHIHRANQSYTYQTQSYNLMNFLEFVSDQYIAVNADYSLNGFLFNKIPLLKRLKFRERITTKVLYGGLSDGNNPDKNASLYKFPIDNQGRPLTYSFDKLPYIEMGLGVSNILNIIRIDYVQRISYLDHLNISKSGIRFGLYFEF